MPNEHFGEYELLEAIDGPMLRHGLQEVHGWRIQAPKRPAELPDRDLLAERHAAFMARQAGPPGIRGRRRQLLDPDRRHRPAPARRPPAPRPRRAPTRVRAGRQATPRPTPDRSTDDHSTKSPRQLTPNPGPPHQRIPVNDRG